MYVSILLSGLLAASAMRLRENDPANQPEVDLPELQAKFRSALDELIEETTNEATPFFNKMGEEIEHCKARLREELSPCRECVVSECGDEVADTLEEQLLPYRSFVAPTLCFELAAKIKMSGLTEPASKRALVSGAIGALKVADWVTEATTGNSISGHVSKATSSWWGRRRSLPSQGVDIKAPLCMRGCNTCRRFMGPTNKFVTAARFPEWSACRQCVQSKCGHEVVEALEAKMHFGGLVKPASERALISGAIGAFSAANAATNIITGNSIVGHVSKATSSWWGRRRRGLPSEGVGMEVRQCMEECDTCQRFIGTIYQLVTSVCGPNIFMEFGTVAAPVKALEELRELNRETAILENIEFTPDYAEVYAVFPSGSMMYESNVPFSGPNMAASLAREFFIKYKTEHEF